jgi:acetyltransferase-like isoleucine patch superfamily enzyme
MRTIRLGGYSGAAPRNEAEVASVVEALRALHGERVRGGFLVAFSSSHGGRVGWCASMNADGGGCLYPLVAAALGAPDFMSDGALDAELSAEARGVLSETLSQAGIDIKVATWLAARVERDDVVTAHLVRERAEDPTQMEGYLRRRTTLLFDLFNAGALRGSDSTARQALLDSFTTLPSRLLDAAGRFIVSPREDPVFLRRVPNFVTADRTGAAAAPAGIDKFPSLLAVRGEELLVDGNRIVPSAMIRDGVHVGKRNIFMFQAAVNIAAYIGDDNLIDSHASIASSAQIGDRNKIGSFVSIEGVLSPANAEPVTIGDDNFFGTFVRIGTGIRIGSGNFIGAGVALSAGTKLKDCRPNGATTGEYVAVRELNGQFNSLAIVPNNAVRILEGVRLRPGEYVLLENTSDFMARFEGDTRIRSGR